MRTKVKAKWIIKLPAGAKLSVAVGDKVDGGQKIALVTTRKIETFDYSGILAKFDETSVGEVNQKFKGNRVEGGEIMCISGGVFKNKICFPISGDFLEIDEFRNLRIEKIGDQEKEVIAPTDGKIIKIEDGKITLEFQAFEFKGNGLVEGKSWGNGKVKVIDEIKDLDFKLKGNILFTNNLSKTFLLKAEVVGLVAVVTSKKISENETVETDLPVLQLDEKEWWDFLNLTQEKEEKILVNSRVGRLLLVIE